MIRNKNKFQERDLMINNQIIQTIKVKNKVKIHNNLENNKKSK